MFYSESLNQLSWLVTFSVHVLWINDQSLASHSRRMDTSATELAMQEGLDTSGFEHVVDGAIIHHSNDGLEYSSLSRVRKCPCRLRWSW